MPLKGKPAQFLLRKCVLHLPGSTACLCYWVQRDTRNWATLMTTIHSVQGEDVMQIKALIPKSFVQMG